MTEQTIKIYTKTQTDAAINAHGPKIWVLNATETRPAGVQVGDIIFRRPA